MNCVLLYGPEVMVKIW